MTDLSPRARELVASARVELTPDAERIARGRDRLLAATAITAATAAGVAAAHAAPAVATAHVGAAAGGGAGLKLVALGLGLALVVGAVIAVPRMRAPVRPPEHAVALAPPAMLVPDPATPSVAAVATAIDPAAIDPTMIELEPNAPARPKHARAHDGAVVTAIDSGSVTEPPAVPAAASTDPLSRELELLRSAKAGLRSGATIEGLSILASYQREFPHGQLAEEAAALELDLLCAAGRADEVVRQRARFLDRWPSSALRQRVERACEPR